ncbi:SPOSA6832_04461 [Sporobolomyces salmonicolor]|uniref:SPOSA6832_04461-mRNA-1:cds n=1 Tax=Sporidiobolus salmonicolor TaxID=5005 RepID=A0A0D6ERP6_SPOSA|nr:SPOSA6832_04461 [Sporobolomyces salmonicolor]
MADAAAAPAQPASSSSSQSSPPPPASAPTGGAPADADVPMSSGSGQSLSGPTSTRPGKQRADRVSSLARHASTVRSSTAADAKADELPEDASEVVYVNNLNEKIKLDILFREYGLVLGVTAHRNLRMRGQAFVTLDSKEAAAKAVKEVQKFPLYGKPMQLTFARTESDALVKKRHPEDMDQHKEERLKRKTRRIPQMPDEYLPPNKILFVQNLPDDTTKESLEALFRPCVRLTVSPSPLSSPLPPLPSPVESLTSPHRCSFPNLVEVRTIPGRRNIAFVEFADEGSSSVARDALHNTKFGAEAGKDEGLKLKVTFAKKG